MLEKQEKNLIELLWTPKTYSNLKYYLRSRIFVVD